MLASVAHRASGIALVLLVPLYIWLLHGMTGGQDNFDKAFDWMHSGIGKFYLLVAGTALAYHFFNGIRFLCLDAGWGENRDVMRLSAKIVLIAGAVTALLLLVLL